MAKLNQNDDFFPITFDDHPDMLTQKIGVNSIVSNKWGKAMNSKYKELFGIDEYQV